MKLNFNGWTKHKETPEHAIMRNPEGHEIKIVKHALSPKFRGQLAAIPLAKGGQVPNRAPMSSQDEPVRMAEGGEAPENSPTTAPVTINIGNPSGPQGMENANPGSQFAAKEASSQPQPVNPANVELPYGITPEMMTQMQASAPQAPPAPSGGVPSSPVPEAPKAQESPLVASPSSGVAVPDVISAYGQGQQGIQAQAAAEGALGLEQAAILKSQVDKEHAAMAHAQALYNQLDTERKGFVNDINNQHIDPKHYWNSKDTGAKVSTAIGLILGGIGGGAAGGPNQALQFLQSNIDRDIDSQRANIGKTQNLLSANLHQFGNMRDATEMTRLMQMDIISNQLKMAAAKAADPMAKARALQASAQLEQQAAPGFQRLAVRQALMQPGSPGNQLINQDPAKYVRFIADEKDQPGLYKEIAEAQQTTKAARNIMHAFDQIVKLNTPGNRLSSPLQTRSQIAAIAGPITAGLSKETAGRFTEQDAQYLNSLWKGMVDNPNTVAVKRAQVQRLITEKMNFPMLKAYDLDPEKFQSTSGAAENVPAPEVQTRNGVQYMKVPGGWKRAQ